MLDRRLLVSGLQKMDKSSYDFARQTLVIDVNDMSPGRVYRITVTLDPPLRESFRLNDLWDDFGSRIMAFAVCLLAVLVYLIFM